MKIIEIYKETNEIQRVLTLRNSRNSRFRYQEFIIEGRDAVDQAVQLHWPIKTIFYNKEITLSSWAKRVIEESKCELIYAITTALMEKISDKSVSPELIAIGITQLKAFSSYQPFLHDVVIVLDEPKSSGNMGMMIRSAAAFGVSAIVISGRSADEYDPQSVRSSLGQLFSIPIYHVEGIAAFTQHLHKLKEQCSVSVIASGDKASKNISNTNFRSELLFLILGSETSGISSGYKELADHFVKIELKGTTTSLNIAAAGSIFLYEIFKQRELGTC
jgi:tRNA G18 (ribose-2'-O)-methylase SpoU